MEGTTVPSTQDPADPPPNDPRFTPPVYDYPYDGGYGSGGADPFGGRSVTGGVVYRGPVTELQGQYVFGDWSSHQVWSMEIDRDADNGLGDVVAGSLTDLSTLFNRQTAGGTSVTEGVTAFGEDTVGNLYYVELGGELWKIVGDIVGDVNGDSRVDDDDFIDWNTGFTTATNFGDADKDGDTDGNDYLLIQQNYGAGVPPATATGGAVPEPGSGALAAIAVLALAARRRCRD
jgi:hypothetical protein